MNKKNAFNWDINQTQILNAQGQPIKGYKEITRNDDGASIAVMKDSFHPMTTQEFTNTAYAVAEHVGTDEIRFEDWQSGKNMGKRQPVVTAQIKINSPFSIGGSKMEGFLTLGVGFNGERSFYIGNTQNYLRCTNQFGRIVKNFTSRLTKNNLVRVEEIIKNIENYNEYEQKLYESFKKMQEVKIDEKIIEEVTARLMKLSDEERLDKNIISTQKLNKIDDFMLSVRTECEDLGYNAFSLFNSCTHYTTHVMKSTIDDNFGNMFGAKGEFNQTGYNFCMELLENK